VVAIRASCLGSVVDKVLRYSLINSLFQQWSILSSSVRGLVQWTRLRPQYHKNNRDRLRMTASISQLFNYASIRLITFFVFSCKLKRPEEPIAVSINYYTSNINTSSINSLEYLILSVVCNSHTLHIYCHDLGNVTTDIVWIGFIEHLYTPLETI
jgi:hypothetical protein